MSKIKVTSIKPSACGQFVVASYAAGAEHSIVWRKGLESPAIVSEARVGGDFTLLQRLVRAMPQPIARAARGLDGQNSPQTIAAIRSARLKQQKVNAMTKLAKKTAKPAKSATPAKATKATAKAKPAAKATAKAKPAKAEKPSAAEDTRKITVLNKAFEFGREGTKRNDSWLACTKAETVAAYVAAGGAVKYLARWEAAKAISIG